MSLPDDLAALAVHPHMLQHACGYDLAGRDGDIHKTASFLGHKRIDTTMSMGISTRRNLPGCGIDAAHVLAQSTIDAAKDAAATAIKYQSARVMACFRRVEHVTCPGETSVSL